MTPTLQFPEARRRVIAARTALVLDEPFWGTLALRLTLVEDPSHRTAWTDGTRMGYSPAFVMSLTQKQLRGLIAHEVMHCSNGHPWRRGMRDRERWNIACDRVINPMLREAGFELPPRGLYELDPSHLGKSAEWVYDRLPTDPPSQDGGQSQGGGQGSGEPSSPSADGGTGAGSDGAGNDPGLPQGQPGPQGHRKGHPEGRSSGTGQPSANGDVCPEDTHGGQGSGDHKSDGFDEVRDAPPHTTEEEEAGSEGELDEADWQRALVQAATIARGQGKLPGNMKRLIDQMAQPRVDWRSTLRRFVQEVARSDYSFARPNARYVRHGLYLPALHSHEVGVIAVGIDTSGSIDNVLLSQFAAELRAIQDEVKPKEIRVLYCDATIQGEEVFRADDEVRLTAHGGGGTDFRPVFDRVQHEWDEEPVALIYMTDLWGTFPEHEPPFPTLWVTPFETRQTVPFGELVSATY